MEYTGITRQEIVELGQTSSDPAVSIYVPTARTGPEVMQSRIKLKNLITQAENHLVDRGLRRTLAIDLLKSAAGLDQDEDFWNKRLDSVALFIGPSLFKAYHLPFTSPEFIEVSNRFNVRPLADVLTKCLCYYVLALDKNNVRLVHFDYGQPQEVHVPNMPLSIDEFIKLEYAAKDLQFHSAGRAGQVGGVISHVAGDQGVDPKDRLHRFCLAIGHAVEKRLANSKEPLALVGTEENQAFYRAVSRYPHLLEKGAVQTPKMLNGNGLREAVAPIIREFEDKPRVAAAAHFSEMAGTGLTSEQLEDILPAAQDGKVDVLFIRSQATAWGVYTPETHELRIHEKPGVGDVELINQAALATLHNSGVVYPAGAAQPAFTGPVAAIYRY